MVFMRVVVCASLFIGLTAAAEAQNYPNKVIRLFTSEPGSAGDLAARLLAQGLSAPLGQPVIIENRPGQIIGIETVARSAPDGYTILYGGSGVWLLPFMRDSVPWDPLKDFSPVTLTAGAPNVLMVNPSSGINSVQELIALAKAKPGALNYAMGGRGNSTHITSELFLSMANVNIVGVPYKGNIPGLQALLAGEVQLVFASGGSGGPYVKSGKLRGLAVSSADRSVLFPGLPTVAESGLPGFESGSTVGILAPAKTPEAIIRRLNQEIVRLLKTPEVKERFINNGTEASGSTPEEFTVKIKSEMTRLGKVIRDVGIRAE
jgi:tripartite-type tricarboxylate transporter receptor subunit TctC